MYIDSPFSPAHPYQPLLWYCKISASGDLRCDSDPEDTYGEEETLTAAVESISKAWDEARENTGRNVAEAMRPVTFAPEGPWHGWEGVIDGVIGVLKNPSAAKCDTVEIPEIVSACVTLFFFFFFSFFFFFLTGIDIHPPSIHSLYCTLLL